MNTTSNISANTFAPSTDLQNQSASDRYAAVLKLHRRLNKLPDLVDQRWPHPDRRVRRVRQPIPPPNTPAPTRTNSSIDVLQAAANIRMAKTSGIATTALSTSRSMTTTGGRRFPFSFRPHTLSLPSRLPRMGAEREAAKELAAEDAASSTAASTNTSTTTIAASATGTAPPVQPVRLWSEAQLAHAQRTRQSDAMAAEIARLNAEIRRLETALAAHEPEREAGRVPAWVGTGHGRGRGRAGVRESWVTLDLNAGVVQRKRKPSQGSRIRSQNGHGLDGTRIQRVKGEIDQASEQVGSEEDDQAVFVEDLHDFTAGLF
ncbi:hypothetical protein DV735_g2869, partial [Chaetothyriales sp. CBS 134920]